jgi:hypothetical protein
LLVPAAPREPPELARAVTSRRLPGHTGEITELIAQPDARQAERSAQKRLSDHP